ncbi:MAG TPA: CotH kinase family protein [Vicingaceae bacterium]
MKFFIPFYIFLSLLFYSCNPSDKNTEDKKISIQPLKEIYIEINLNDFKTLYTNYQDNTYFPIKIMYDDEVKIAKMRIRGDSSRKDKKKSLKIKFDDVSFFNEETVLNLNAEYSDKTLIRQFLSSKLMQQNGVQCYDSELIKVFLNREYFGIYLKVENMDDQFLTKRNLSTDNNLYKATKDGACLSIFDDVPAKWEKKTNKKGDFNDLTSLIDKLNNTPDNKFETFIKENFAYEQLVNLIAMNMMLSNGSTYYHNYYLYHDLYETGKWLVFPWDMDKSLSYYNWMPYTYHQTSSEWESDNPLIERAILCEPIFNDIKKRIEVLHQTNLNDQKIAPIVDELISLLNPIIEKDTLDKITSKKEWLDNISKEKNYFDPHYQLLQKQFNEQPYSFKVYRFDQFQTDTITFKWSPSKHPQNKPISYILVYGTDFLLTDSSKTNYIKNITDTFFSLPQLSEGIYYWKVMAFDGKNYTDGFNTKNILEVKTPTIISKNISKNTIWTKQKSPYLITNHLIINDKVNLSIESGVTVLFNNDISITCNGSITAEGTQQNPIIFRPNNTANNWDHIYFYEKSRKGYFKHVHFYEGVINFKNTDITLDSCKMTIDKKILVHGENAVIWGSKGKIDIKNSTFKSNNTGEGLVLYDVEASTESNAFYGMPDAVEYILCNKGVIRNNLIINSSDDAIDLNACNNILIENNFIINNADKGISIGTEQYGPSKEGIIIRNNLFVGNKTPIAVKDSSFALVHNNTMYNNKRGIYVYKKREDYKKGGDVIAYNNILYNCDDFNAYADEWSTLKADYNMVNTKSIGGTNLHASPKFINPEKFDFRLRKNSPAIKTGKENTDIGAFPYNSASISLVKVHLKSSEKNNSGDWIEILNHYNMDLDLSGYKIVVEYDEKTKYYTFPNGSILPRLSSIYVVDDYSNFTTTYPFLSNIYGSLPKINNKTISIKIINNLGDEIDNCHIPNISSKNEHQRITLISNKASDKALIEWTIQYD